MSKTRRHLDYYQRKARREGYRARSAYKLTAMDDRLRLFARARVIIELGCAPGGWTQVVRERAPRALVITCDLKEMHPLAGVRFIQGDFTAARTLHCMKELMKGSCANLILADTSPDISGQALVDQAASCKLVQQSMNFAHELLEPQEGRLLTKFFQGEETEHLILRAKEQFRHVSVIKPAASRKDSRENYLYLRGMKV